MKPAGVLSGFLMAALGLSLVLLSLLAVFAFERPLRQWADRKLNGPEPRKCWACGESVR